MSARVQPATVAAGRDRGMSLSDRNWQEIAQALDRDLTRVKGLLEEAIQQIEYECGERDTAPYEASLSNVAYGLRDRLRTGGQPKLRDGVVA